MYNNRARSKSRNRAEVTPTLFPTAFVPLPPKNDKSRMQEAIAKKKVNPYDQSRAVPNTPSQVRPMPPQRSIAQPILTPLTDDPKRNNAQNAMPVRSGFQATPVNRVQQPHHSRSVQQEIRKSPAPSPRFAAGTGNERVRPTTPNHPVQYPQQSKQGQVQQKIPNNIPVPAPSPSIEIVGSENGSSSVRRPTPTRLTTTTSIALHNTRANGAPRFKWAEKNPDEVLGRAKSIMGEQQRVAQMSDFFLDEPDEPPPMDFPESALHSLSIHPDHPHPPIARKRPHTDSDTDEEPVLGEEETARTSFFEEQPQLAQEIDAHFEQAQAREEMTKKLQETFISFITNVNEQKRVAKENFP